MIRIADVCPAVSDSNHTNHEILKKAQLCEGWAIQGTSMNSRFEQRQVYAAKIGKQALNFASSPRVALGSRKTSSCKGELLLVCCSRHYRSYPAEESPSPIALSFAGGTSILNEALSEEPRQ